MEKLLPVRLKPQNDELMSSWITRLAFAHGLSGNFLAAILLENNNYKNKLVDLDRVFDKTLFQILSNVANIEYEQVYNKSLISLEGNLFEKFCSSLPNLPLIIPKRVRLKTEEYGTQFCPQCLNEDITPYFRKQWRLSFVVLCQKHNTYLNDRCPKCFSSFNYYSSFSLPLKVPKPIYICKICNFDIRATNTIREIKPSREEIVFQKHLLEVLKKGWVRLSSKVIYSHLYFRGIQLLMSFIAKKTSSNFRNEVIKFYKIAPLPINSFGNYKAVETLNNIERRSINILSSKIMNNWFKGFIHLCKKTNTTYNNLLHKVDDAPYWYWSVIYYNLYLAKYNYSEEEIESVFKFLTNKTKKPHRKELTHLIGRGHYKLLTEKWLRKTKQPLITQKCIECKSFEKEVEQIKEYEKLKKIKNTFCHLCKRNYTPKTPKKIHLQSTREQVYKLRNNGETYESISRKLSIPLSSIAYWCKKRKNTKK